MDAKTKDLIAAMAKAKKWWTVPEIEKVFEAGEVPQKVEKPKVEKAPAPAKMKKAAGTDAKKGKKAKGSKKAKAAKVEEPIAMAPAAWEEPVPQA